MRKHYTSLSKSKWTGVNFFLKKISIRVFFSYILTIGGIAGEVRGPSNFSLPPPSTYEQTDMYLQLYLWDDYHIFLFASHVISHLIDWWWNVNCVCNCYSSFFLFFFLTIFWMGYQKLFSERFIIRYEESVWSYSLDTLKGLFVKIVSRVICDACGTRQGLCKVTSIHSIQKSTRNQWMAEDSRIKPERNRVDK